MASIGVNVALDGQHSPELVRSLGATWIRIVATPDHDLSGYFRACREAGVRVLLVFARESGLNYGAYAERYGHLVDAVQVANEPDLESPSSWTMSPAALASLGRAVRSDFPQMPIVCAGLASGHPDWLNGMDLSWADALAVHPYAKDSENPADLEDQPDVQPLIREYARFGKPLLITEWGWPSDQEPRASEEVRDIVAWAGRTGDIECFFYFCISDSMVPPFGLLGPRGGQKPKVRAFKEQAALAVHSLWPSVVEEPPAPVGPDPWQHFSAEAIASAAQCPLDAVSSNWPRLVEQLGHCGINDRATQIAMIGTVAIESASTFRPVREAYYLGEPEPAESYRRTLRYYPYYGRGFIQITWRENYASYGQKVAQLWGAGGWEPDFDLVGNPDNALNPDISAAISALYFRDHARADGIGIPEAAWHGNWLEVRRLVYGGTDTEGAARIGRIAAALGTAIPPADDLAELRRLVDAYEVALRTLRDDTIPKLEAQLAELRRIVEQMVGRAA